MTVVDNKVSIAYNNDFFKPENSVAETTVSTPKKAEGLNLKIKASIVSHKQDMFLKIMELDGIKPQDIMESLAPETNRNRVFKAGQGAGLSGQFFFFSSDNRFLIKTIT